MLPEIAKTPVLMRQVVLRIVGLCALVLFLAETMIVIYYHSYGRERVIFELIVTATITLVVSFPIASYLTVQSEQLKALTARLKVLSSTDLMTGLLNRQTFLDRLSHSIAARRGSSGAGVFLFLDADHFKSINDRFGHAAGDQVIIFLAGLIREEATANGLAARLGGEEFGLFLYDATLEQATAVAERLRRSVESSGSRFGPIGWRFSVSIGIAGHHDGMGCEQVMDAADKSLYAAKNSGRNAVVVEMKRSAA